MITRTNATSPRAAGWFNPLVDRALRAGLPLGPNALLTVRGRRSGLPRTAPIAVLEIGGRRWLQSPYGDTEWARNLRAAGACTVRRGRRSREYTAVAYGQPEAEQFFRSVLAPYLEASRLRRLIFASLLGGKDVIADPAAAARRFPVFELLETEDRGRIS